MVYSAELFREWILLWICIECSLSGNFFFFDAFPDYFLKSC